MSFSFFRTRVRQPPKYSVLLSTISNFLLDSIKLHLGLPLREFRLTREFGCHSDRVNRGMTVFRHLLIFQNVFTQPVTTVVVVVFSHDLRFDILELSLGQKTLVCLE